jgi:hypothetical protein
VIDFSSLIPDNSPFIRGYGGWRCGTIRGYFAPNEWIAIALEGFNPAGSFPLPIIYGVFFVPSFKEFLVAPRDNPMPRVCPIHI